MNKTATETTTKSLDSCNCRRYNVPALPAVANLAALRDAVAATGGDPRCSNPLIPVDPVSTHNRGYPRIRLTPRGKRLLKGRFT